MRIILRYTLPFLATILISSQAISDELSYSYAQGGYQTFTGDADDGFFLGGSFRINDDIYIYGEYDQWETSQRVGGVRGSVEFTSLSVRGGYIFPIEEGFDVYGEAGLARNEIKSKASGGGFSVSMSDDDIGLVLAGGVRMLLTPEFEARGGLELFTGDYDEKFLIGEGVYHLNEQFSLTGSAARALDVSEFRLRIGARFNF